MLDENNTEEINNRIGEEMDINIGQEIDKGVNKGNNTALSAEDQADWGDCEP
jgi:hypothetical protein